MTDRIDGVEKIAVLRVNGLGDYVMALPALEALRAAYPRAEIVLLAGDWHQDFVAGRPGPVDRVVLVPGVPGVGRPADFVPDEDAVRHFLAAMRAERFDLAVQMHGGGRYSNTFLRRLGARVTVGTRSPDAAPLDRSIPYVYYAPEVFRWLEVSALVGAPAQGYEPRLAVTADDLAAASAALGDASDAPLVALHPAATDPRRCWPAERFAGVGDALAAAGARVIVTGSPEEAALAGAVAQAMDAPALPLAGRTTLAGLVGVLSRCAVVVGNDSGPLHVARAVGAPTVTVYWVGNMINAGPPSRARHRPHISWTVCCPSCDRHLAHDPECGHQDSVVRGVPLADVRADALDLLVP